MNAHRPSMRQRAGFTLVELMVSMSIGLAVVGGAYYITRTTSRMFAEQLRRSETQLTLRGAVELMRRDISRAGFAGVRSTSEMPGCTNTSGVRANGVSGWVGTIGNTAINVSPVALAAAWIDPTPAGPRLYLTGNFSTSEQYVVNGNSNNNTPTSLELQTTQHSFMRSFMTAAPPIGPAPPEFLVDRFQDAFLATRAAAPPGRMVNVVNLYTRKSFLRHVTGVVADVDNPSVQLLSALPTGLPGEAGCNWGPFATITPISTIVYEVVNTNADPTVAGAVGAGADYMSGGARLVLVRREVDMLQTLGPGIPPLNAPPVVIPGTTRAVVDFVEPQNGFTIEAVYDTVQQNAGAAPQLQRMAVVNTNPLPLESLRSLVIQIVARSAEDETLGELHERQRAFAGRRVARFEVFLPNLSRNPGTRP